MLFAWHTSATVPPAAATAIPGGTVLVNGYVTVSAAGAAPYYNDLAQVARPSGAGTVVTFYPWASADNGTTWSVGAGVAVTFP